MHEHSTSVLHDCMMVVSDSQVKRSTKTELDIVSRCLLSNYIVSVACMVVRWCSAWLGHRTCDREIASSTPGWCIAPG